MLREMRQVLRLIKLIGKQREKAGLKTVGGLLVLLWTHKASSSLLNCTVAAAGPWCVGVKLQTLHSDLKKILLPSVWPCPEPDPEELSDFTDLYGSLQFLLTFQIRDPGPFTPKWSAPIKAFLRSFSLTNAGIGILLKLNLHEAKSQHHFRVWLKSKVTLAVQPPLMLDIVCSAPTPRGNQKGSWCQGGHPVVGERFPLSIPPRAMDQGLFGELSVQLVTLLSPCLLQYPNLPTELSRMQFDHKQLVQSFAVVAGCEAARLKKDDQSVLVYTPSNIPVSAPLSFFQTLPAALDCQQLGLDRIICSSFKGSYDDFVHSCGVVYTVEQENWDDPEQEAGRAPVQQGLLVFLFLQHIDPFTSELRDIVADELLIEHHLEDILSNNSQAVTSALKAELFNTVEASKQRKKRQEKLQSAAEVILSSTISIVSSSSNINFRNTCLKLMKVCDTHELSASLRESLWGVTSWKFVSKVKCYSAQVKDQAESDALCRAEI